MLRGIEPLFMVLCFCFLAACGGSPAGGLEETGSGRAISVLLDQGDPDGAEKKLESLTTSEESSAWVDYWRGRIALARAEAVEDDSTGREELLALAIESFTKALEAEPTDYYSMVYLGKAQGLNGDFVQAIKRLEKAINQSPDRGDAYFEMGRIYVRTGEVDAAMGVVSRGLGKDPQRPDGLLFYGEIVFNYRSLYDEGLSSMREAVALDPDFPGAKDQLADSLLYLSAQALNKDAPDAALAMVSEVLDLCPAHLDALRLRAQAYTRNNHLDGALEDLRQCLKQAPSDEASRQLLARILIKKGYQLLFLKRRDEALTLFGEAVGLNAPDVDTTVVARILDEDRQRVEERTPGQDEAPENHEARALFEEASTLLEAGQAKEALALLRKSIEILPNNPFAHHQAGLALDLLNQPEEAERELKLALSLAHQLEIEVPATYLKLADLAIRAERFDEGESYLSEHAGRFPDQVSNPVAVGLRRKLMMRD
ncbi:MAG: tetratricopeptide repeat protein [Planctomycetes bacterium]|nr:tetratricopeptide repeat protein [Planctomycetota bacterium]